MKPIWILLKQVTVSGSGISWAICKSAPRSRQTTTPAPHHSVFYRPGAFLLPNQQCQITEGNNNSYKGYGVNTCFFWCQLTRLCCILYKGPISGLLWRFFCYFSLIFSHGSIPRHKQSWLLTSAYIMYFYFKGGSVAEWLACWTQAQKGPGSNRSRNAVG